MEEPRLATDHGSELGTIHHDEYLILGRVGGIAAAHIEDLIVPEGPLVDRNLELLGSSLGTVHRCPWTETCIDPI